MQFQDRAGWLGPFGAAEDVAVQRGISEFQAGRPVIVAAADERIVASPVDGLTETTWCAFRSVCAPGAVRLVITKNRARVLGLDAAGPVFVTVAADDSRDVIWSLAAGLHCDRPSAAGMAGAAAARAIDLAKLAQRFPALLVAEAEAVAPAVLAQLIAVDADALARVNER